MGKFKSFLNEIKKSELMRNTDKNRIKLSKQMRVRPPKIIELDSGLERMEYRAKMSPAEKSVEGKAHWGYIDYEPKNKNIHQVWCSCKDFSYRLYYPYEKDDLATWTLDKKYKKKEPFKHNEQPTKITNPSNTLFACKHIYGVLRDYF